MAWNMRELKLVLLKGVAHKVFGLGMHNGVSSKKNKGRPRGRLHSDDQVSKQKTPNNSVSKHRNCDVLKARNCILTNFSLVLKSLVRTVCKRENG